MNNETNIKQNTPQKERPTPLPYSFLGAIDNDFRAEVTAAELVENGTASDRLLLLLQGGLKRSFSRDVNSIEEETSEYDHRDYTLIKTPKEGLYDMLPQGLFHKPGMHKKGQTEKEVIKAIKQRRQEEQDARLFFLPFEAGINHLRILLAWHENRLDKRWHYDDLLQVFEGHWPIFRHLDARQANLFLYLIPILHDVRDNFEAAENILNMLLQLPVHINLRRQLPQRPAHPFRSKMGEAQLGINLTTGNEIHDEGVDEILVHIGPVSRPQFRDFMPGGNNHTILQMMCGYLLPVHLDQVTEIELDAADKFMQLAGGEVEGSVIGEDCWL
ncbi:type VI secretion system baseplate subunit TssG [Foetidibacter luteolus]|uniref:type VI secretion system baseplate subunit TssG n=1 Tax=Foetidibacter luteolus TaxID=2608880 RepID=UPI001A99DEE3|nr:type VI secretion system baseplate subunit TssG [Foetidibacter luteolus]